MVQSGRPFSLKYLRERGDFESVSSSFVSFMKNEINHSNLRLSTLKNHLSTLQVLCQYQPQVSFDDLILTKRIFLQFKQILINRQVDISFQMLHMLGNRIPVVLLLKKKMFKTTKEIKGKIIKRDLWLILAQNLQSG